MKNNFGKSNGDIIYWKNAYFHKMHMWLYAQLEQKIFDDIFYSKRSLTTARYCREKKYDIPWD